jgi:hypothetical protein
VPPLRSLLAAVLLAACGARPAPVSPPLPSTAPAAAAPTAPIAASAASPALPAPFVSGFRRQTPEDPANLCEPAVSNVDRAADAILHADRAGAPGPTWAPWDRVTPPRYLSRVTERFALTRKETAALFKNGFVVPARLATAGYTQALNDIYQAELPLYVSVDAVLHAVYKSNDDVIAEVEVDSLTRHLTHLLDGLHAELRPAAASYPPAVAADLDVYLTVARSLLADAAAPSALGNDAAAAGLVARVKEARGMISLPLFGRSRVVDFSQMQPRGHYASAFGGILGGYFRASMWLSRIELNLVSRSSRSSAPGIVPDPTETPEEDVLALALADLCERAKVLDDLAALDAAWGAFAGRREDVSVGDLLALRRKAGIASLVEPDAAPRLRAALGNDFQRTARTHYMPQGSTILPAIATLLGPRVAPDAAAESRLVHQTVPGRFLLGVADAGCLLGHDRAKAYLRDDLATFPALAPELEAGRAILAAPPAGADLYGAWLAAIVALADRPAGALPSFMKTEAFADLRLGSAIAAYAQLRHNSVLLAAQAYEEGGCEVPDGFVEPAPRVYEGLMRYAERGATAMRALGDDGAAGSFDLLRRRLAVLDAIALDELAGRPLSEEEKRYLSMVAEVRPATTTSSASYDGWYFDLFLTQEEAFADPALLADFYTSTNLGVAVYAGVRRPSLGLFVVDTGGPPRIVVGPVARAFEHRAGLDKRLDDTAVATLAQPSAPWERSYVVAAPPEPPIAVTFLDSESAPEGKAVSQVFAAKSAGPPRRVVIEALDHHSVVVGTGEGNVGPHPARIEVRVRPGAQPMAFRVRVGELSVEADEVFGAAVAAGGMKPLEWAEIEAVRSGGAPPRP